MSTPVRLDIDPSIIPVVKSIGQKYDAKHALDAPRLSNEPAYLITEGPCACKIADKNQGVYKPFTAFPVYNTGHIQAFDNVCGQCRKHWDKFARIVCKNCKLPVVMVVPHKDRKGFPFVAGKTYHVTACPSCNPEAKIAVPLEKIVFDYKASGSNLPLKEFMRLTIASA